MQSQIFPTKPTAGKVDELEALLTAQRLSFLASSTTTGLTGSLHEAIADFRVALNPRSHMAASPALSRLEVPNQVPAYTKDSEAPTKAGELDMATPMPCVCSESAMVGVCLFLV
ncbi:hypothetical protein M407DRAFT_182877 [Tulasnella calospora MUT 4182]|uniref:Uncharacterized protein n=1 Tax=Tulasnella calospora MUT 4182 TaxID=1051891 RepID=A0A0C3QCA8_9AGAM|nr:hypothetical protein M407DRAFT_182877 [Tulasnella calospora MUT 4182]